MKEQKNYSKCGDCQRGYYWCITGVWLSESGRIKTQYLAIGRYPKRTMDEEVKKWTCEYCTFENWPQAIKCTLCRGMKPPRLIPDGILNNRDEESVQLSELIVTNNIGIGDGGGGGGGGSGGRDTGGGKNNDNLNFTNSSEISVLPGDGTIADNAYTKWSCHRCTYLNWPRANRCTQCRMARVRTSPINTLGSICESSWPTKDYSGAYNEAGPPLRNSPNSPEPPARDSGLSDQVRTLTNKWVCSACTYENWPKSLRCVLCQTFRHRHNDSSSPTARSISPECEENRRNGSSKRSPVIDQPQEAPILNSCAASTSASAGNNYEQEMRLKQLRNCMREADWSWLNACLGVVNGDPNPVEVYLSSGGDPSRQLTQSEVNLLSRPRAFDVGHTLVHLAIRSHREDLLALLLTSVDASCGVHKRMPSQVSPDLANDIKRHLVASLRKRKGDFPCHFFSEIATFALPSEIEDLPQVIQEQLFDELQDRDVQKELEEESPVINWSLELTERLGSRLYALWNRTAGDCLLDSVLQATWGIFDRDNILRRALSDSLHDAASVFYPRWKEYETMQARLMHYTIDESQCQRDWAFLLSLASQPGASLEQMHIFTLAHILRRPIIVYGVKYVKSFRGEAIGFARFEGVYLPLLWEQSLCWKSPIALGYTRGHFSALIPMEPETNDNLGAGADIRNTDELKLTFLPLTANDGKLLPVPFLSNAEVGHEERILRQWLDCCIMEGGILVAQQRIQRRPLLVAQMVEEWLNYYRCVNHYVPRSARPVVNRGGGPAGYASDGDSDDE
ncbi:Ubiquitin thioesterase Zranb1 [Chamberlinius hualienensis]